MADEKPRAPRARKPKAEAAVASAKPTVKKKAPTATPRARKRTVAEPQVADVATHAYLLWERGEPGSADEHWLRAEQELAAA